MQKSEYKLHTNLSWEFFMFIVFHQKILDRKELDLNLWVMTSTGTTYQISCMSYIYSIINNSKDCNYKVMVK